jgi:hypothetical protein
MVPQETLRRRGAGEDGMIASDLIDGLPEAWRVLAERQREGIVGHQGRKGQEKDGIGARRGASSGTRTVFSLSEEETLDLGAGSAARSKAASLSCSKAISGTERPFSRGASRRRSAFPRGGVVAVFRSRP